MYGTRKTSTLLSAAILLVLAAACGGSSQGPSRIDPSEVLAATLSLEDTERTTPVNGTFPGAASRRIEVNLWYAPAPLAGPACTDARCGLLVLAHGFGGNPDRFDILARSLAARGWIVAALWFPLTNESAPGGFGSAIGDLASQPGDIRFLLDRLLAADAADEGPLRGRIDDSRIGVVGHSLGGATTIALDRHDCCREPRIGANFMVAPATMILPLFGDSASNGGSPTLISVGTADAVIPPEMMRGWLADLPGPWTLAVMEEYDHVTHIEAGAVVPFPERIEETASLAHAFFLDALTGADELEGELEKLRAAGHEIVSG